ncbi:MAG: hypothetical protein ED559_02655 [Phycisphaera sp.]|nr:MAG: hypothetical protein ED559_02655 [Phycisphaera sp.]
MASLLVLAQPVGQETRQPDDTPLLTGPAVDKAKTRSLVQGSMRGGFARVEGRPEFAAARLLDLDEETLDRIRELEEERGLSIVILLIDRIDDLRDMTDAQLAGDNARALEILSDLWNLHDEGELLQPAIDELEAVLTEQQLDEADRISSEYMHAWASGEKRQNEDLEQTKQRLAFSVFQQEVRDAYDASLLTTRQAMQGIYDAVDPTPEQRETLRTIVIDHIKTTRLKATPAQRRAAMRRMYDALDEERQGKLFDYIMRAVVPD